MKIRVKIHHDSGQNYADEGGFGFFVTPDEADIVLQAFDVPYHRCEEGVQVGMERVWDYFLHIGDMEPKFLRAATRNALLQWQGEVKKVPPVAFEYYLTLDNNPVAITARQYLMLCSINRQVKTEDATDAIPLERVSFLTDPQMRKTQRISNEMADKLIEIGHDGDWEVKREYSHHTEVYEAAVGWKLPPEGLAGFSDEDVKALEQFGPVKDTDIYLNIPDRKDERIPEGIRAAIDILYQYVHNDMWYVWIEVEVLDDDDNVLGEDTLSGIEFSMRPDTYYELANVEKDTYIVEIVQEMISNALGSVDPLVQFPPTMDVTIQFGERKEMADELTWNTKAGCLEE